MNARANILAKVKKSLGAPADDATRAATVSERIKDAPTGILPARAQLPAEERIAVFVKYAEKYNATVARIGSITDLPKEVSTYLKSRNLPASVRMGADPLLTGAGFDSERTLEIKSGPSDGSDLAGVSHARAAIAETGTLVLASGPDNPVTITFLPEHHIVAVKASDIGATMEEAFEGIRQTYGKGTMPRTVNMVTGPSRSGDIEQTILLGAHGPRALHIVIVD
ncbi:LutC/YkgG family protein [Rhizobium sp. PAMB 3182]